MKAAAEQAQAQWASKVTYWSPEGWVAGVPVKVTSERTKGKKGLSYIYQRHVRNNFTGSEWIDVQDKYGHTSSFKIPEVSLITPKKKRTRRKA